MFSSTSAAYGLATFPRISVVFVNLSIHVRLAGRPGCTRVIFVGATIRTAPNATHVTPYILSSRGLQAWPLMLVAVQSLGAQRSVVCRRRVDAWNSANEQWVSSSVSAKPATAFDGHAATMFLLTHEFWRQLCSNSTTCLAARRGRIQGIFKYLCRSPRCQLWGSARIPVIWSTEGGSLNHIPRQLASS